MRSDENDYYSGLDVLRLIAAIGIVGRHLNLFPCTKVASVLLLFTDLNVGVFGAISGFFMARAFDSETFGLKSFVLRRAKRLLPAYFFWTMIYIAFSSVFSFITTGGLNPKMQSLDFWLVGCVFYGGASCHLWYLIALFYIVCLTALLFRALPKLFSCPCGLLATSAIFIWYSAIGGFEWWHVYFFRLAAYVALGCALYNMRRRLANIRVSYLLVLLLCSFMCKIFLLEFVNEFFLDYVCVVPMVILALHCQSVKKSHQKELTFARISLGVYLVHPIFAAGVGYLFARLCSPPFTAYTIVADWLIVAVISVVCAFVMLEWRGSRRLFGA